MNISEIRYAASQFIIHHPQINDAVQTFARNASPIATQDTGAVIPTNGHPLQNPPSAHRSPLTWGHEALEHMIPTRTKANRVATEDTAVRVDSPLSTAI